jgi:hypothetical protein
VANYQNTVLEANREVEDALVAFLQSQERVKSLALTVQETASALDLALTQFTEGQADFTGVFILQADLALKQDQLAAAQGDVAVSLIAVYRALGGGWEIRCPWFEPAGAPLPPVEGVESAPEPLPLLSAPRDGDARSAIEAIETPPAIPAAQDSPDHRT